MKKKKKSTKENQTLVMIYNKAEKKKQNQSPHFQAEKLKKNPETETDTHSTPSRACLSLRALSLSPILPT